MRYIVVQLKLPELKELIRTHERCAINCERFAAEKDTKFRRLHLDTAGKHQTRANQLSRFLPEFHNGQHKNPLTKKSKKGK